MDMPVGEGGAREADDVRRAVEQPSLGDIGRLRTERYGINHGRVWVRKVDGIA